MLSESFRISIQVGFLIEVGLKVKSDELWVMSDELSDVVVGDELMQFLITIPTGSETFAPSFGKIHSV